MTRALTTRRFALLFALCAAPSLVRAEEPPPAPAAKDAGPLTIERLHSGFVIAPESRLAEVDGHFGNFVGGTAGFLTDRTLLIGGAGYWLTNDPNGIEMSYGGLVVQWTVHADRRFAWSARALVGGGGATVTETLGDLGFPTEPRPPYVDPRHPNGGGRYPGFHPGGGPPIDPNARVRVHDGFFVTEPQLSATIRLKEWLRLDAGVGYRLTAGAREGLDERLRGVSGTFALQIGGL